jgi:protein-S-isoprenylcysteine O-methyltransferase Ste14
MTERTEQRTGRPDGSVIVTWLTRVLFGVAVVVMAWRAIDHFVTGGSGHVVGGIFILAYLGWIAAEIPVTFGSPPEKPAESRTLTAYVSSRLVLVIAAVLSPVPWKAVSPLMIPPMLIFACGIALRTVAIRELGKLYTHHVVRRGEHPLVTTGPYRFLRHPAYSGMLLANVGFVLFFHSVASAVALLLLLAALIWRIRTEEGVLWSIPGYPEFAARRPRLIPVVW